MECGQACQEKHRLPVTLTYHEITCISKKVSHIHPQDNSPFPVPIPQLLSVSRLRFHPSLCPADSNIIIAHRRDKYVWKSRMFLSTADSAMVAMRIHGHSMAANNEQTGPRLFTFFASPWACAYSGALRCHFQRKGAPKTGAGPRRWIATKVGGVEMGHGRREAQRCREYVKRSRREEKPEKRIMCVLSARVCVCVCACVSMCVCVRGRVCACMCMRATTTQCVWVIVAVSMILILQK